LPPAHLEALASDEMFWSVRRAMRLMEEVECDMPEKEKKESYPATPSDTRPPDARSSDAKAPDVANQQVVQVLLDLLKQAQQRSSLTTTVELPPEVERDVAFANAEFALIDRGLKMETPFTNVRIEPVSGPANVRTDVRIIGADFVPPASIFFNDRQASREATNVTVKSPTEITATAPIRIEGDGQVDVVITTFGGTVSLANGFRYT
jgi:hypothetical protein